ncbi:MAG: 2-C-methyl-D-erythritol 2,4-cyclodiphosphate synthase [Gammaproteobacteria bacterium]|nr:2-C-methyl-D-erythritol 2,4-cyclodiphosphate synthase [Gammaproteobacteria bacterium]
MRIGHGYDAHKFGTDRPLMLGGVQVPHSIGLIAHSDGDVVLHALCDALLGAAALGDIGKHFPDTDAQFKDIDSRELLRRTEDAIRLAGYRVGNVDITVVAQVPKLKPHIESMRAAIAEDLNVSVAQVNVKATTTEGMGFIGRKEGIGVHAVVLLDDK